MNMSNSPILIYLKFILWKVSWAVLDSIIRGNICIDLDKPIFGHDKKYEAQLWTKKICQKKYFVHNSLNIQYNRMKFSQILGIMILNSVSW